MLIKKHYTEPLPLVGWCKGLDLKSLGYDYFRTRYKGKTCNEWAEELGVHTETIRRQLKQHGTLDNYKPQLMYKGKTYYEWADYYGVEYNSIHNRMQKHGTLEGYTPFKPKTYKGKKYSEWAQELGVDQSSVRRHMNQYGNLDRLIKETV